MPISVRISYYSTGDGERYLFDTAVDHVNTECIIKAILNQDSMLGVEEKDLPKLTGEAIVYDGNEVAFILSSRDNYFGSTFITGVAYTKFSGTITPIGSK